MEWLMGLAPIFMAGILTGLAVAMPFGLYGQLAARLTAEKKRGDARELAYTAIAVDAVFSALILGFMYLLPPIIPSHFGWLMVGLGVVFVVYGLQVWCTAQHCVPGHLPGGFKRPWQFVVVYSVIHPGSIAIFIGTFGVLHANGVLDNPALPWGARLVCWVGVVLGMFIMWAAWFGFVHHMKRRMAHEKLRLIFSRGLAITFVISGVVLLWKSGMIQGWLA